MTAAKNLYVRIAGNLISGDTDAVTRTPRPSAHHAVTTSILIPGAANGLKIKEASFIESFFDDIFKQYNFVAGFTGYHEAYNAHVNDFHSIILKCPEGIL